MNPMKPIASAAGTAGAATGTTAVAFPTDQHAAWQYVVVNRGATELFMKVGPSTGPDASNNTDGYAQICVPAGQAHSYSRGPTDTHAYLYAASNCLYTLLSGSGE